MMQTELRPENRVVAALARALRNTSFYTLDHPVVKTSVEQAATALGEMLARQDEFVLKLVEGEIIANDRPLFDVGAGTANLVGACLRRGIESITFLTRLRTEEVAALVAALVSDPEELHRQGGAAQWLHRSETDHIAVEKLRTGSSPGGAVKTEDIGREHYSSALDVLRATARRARLGLPPEGEPANEAVSELIDSVISGQTAMLGLVSVKGRDEYTFTHALHICILSLELGYSLGLGRDDLRELGVCALLHDIGKIFIPLPILRKPAALNAEEFAIVQQHPLHGALLLCRQKDAPRAAPLVAFEHHLHHDFSGYPSVSQAHTLNLYSLMVGVADVYDALTTDRPYRPPFAPEQALAVMHSQASEFEPRLLGRFTEMLGRYPSGSLVRLTDGRLAVVTRPSPRHAARPFVRLVEWEEETARLAEAEVDLGESDPAHDGFLLSVENTVDPAELGLNVSSLLGGNPFCTE